MSGIGAALSFLTRIPVGGREQGLRGATPWFPWVGAVIGLLLAAVYSLSYRWMPSTLAAAIAVTVGIMVTGALHEDGLADTADALGSGATGDEALRILDDPRLGTYGVLALIVSLSWRVLALASLSPVWAFAGLVLGHALARSAAIVLAGTARPARGDGLGRSATLEISPFDAGIVVVSALAIGAIAGGWWATSVFVLSAISVWWWGRAATTRFGGVTGDVLGACEQVVEMMALAIVAVAAWGGSSPWWA